VEEHRENVVKFVQACEKLGVPQSELFHPEDLLRGRNLEQVAEVVLRLKLVVERRVPDQDVQRLLVRLAGVRNARPTANQWRAKSLLESKNVLLDTSGNRLGPKVRGTRAVRPPAPGLAVQVVDAGRAGARSRNVSSPSISSVSSASSMSTLESVRTGQIDAAFLQAKSNRLNSLAILEAARRNDTISAMDTLQSEDTFEMVDADDLVLVSSFELIAELTDDDEDAVDSEDQDWVCLDSGMEFSSESLGARQGEGDPLRGMSSQAAWETLVDQHQDMLVNSPWRMEIVSSKSDHREPAKASAVLVDLLDSGVPEERRAQVWLLCTGAMKRMALRRTYFVDLLGNERQGAAWERVLRAFTLRNTGFQAAEPTLGKLCRFALAQVGDCEESAFWLLVQLVEFILPADNFASGMSLVVDQFVLSSLLQRRLPLLVQHLQRLAASMRRRPGTLVVSMLPLMHWIKSAFVCFVTDAESPQEEMVARIWDLLVFHGESILWGAALTVLEHAQEALLLANSFNDVNSILKAVLHLSLEDLCTGARVKARAVRGELDKLRSKYGQLVAEATDHKSAFAVGCYACTGDSENV
ncbi:Growth hormone-regulated TBC protein 1, partial [Durusdinium trenchii]